MLSQFTGESRSAVIVNCPIPEHLGGVEHCI
jgi:hypothetical protein